MTATNPELKNTIPDVSMYAVMEFWGFGNILVIVAQILGQHMILCVFGSFGIRPSILEKKIPTPSRGPTLEVKILHDPGYPTTWRLGEFSVRSQAGSFRKSNPMPRTHKS